MQRPAAPAQSQASPYRQAEQKQECLLYTALIRMTKYYKEHRSSKATIIDTENQNLRNPAKYIVWCKYNHLKMTKPIFNHACCWSGSLNLVSAHTGKTNKHKKLQHTDNRLMCIDSQS